MSVNEGSAAERVGIGFGAGGSELRTAIEGFQMTSQGLRKLGSGTVEAGEGKTPGAALGVVGLVATANPAGLIVVLVSWLAIIFATFGLFAPRNTTVIAALFVCALSVSGAILVILEMNGPFSGLMKVSSAPMREALANLGH